MTRTESNARAIGDTVRVRVTHGGRSAIVEGSIAGIGESYRHDPHGDNLDWLATDYDVSVPGLDTHHVRAEEDGDGPAYPLVARLERRHLEFTGVLAAFRPWLRSIGL